MVTIACFASVILTIKRVDDAPAIILLYLYYALFLAFEYYCWDVVYSVYRDFNREDNQNAMPMTHETYKRSLIEGTRLREHLDLSSYV